MHRFDSHGRAIHRVLVAALFVWASSALAQAQGEMQNSPSSTPAEEQAQPGERRVRRLGDITGDEFELDLAIPDAPPMDSASGSDYDLPDPERNDELQMLLSTLATRPGDTAAENQLDGLLSDVLAQAGALVDAGRRDEAAHLLRVVRYVNPRKEGLDEALARLEQLRNVDGWLSAAGQAMSAGDLAEPEEASALHYYSKVLEADPLNEVAARGLMDVQQGLVQRALDSAENLDFDLASEWLEAASGVREDQALVDEARVEIADFRADQADRIEQQILHAIVNRDFDYAEFILIDLIALGDHEDRVSRLRGRLEEARTYGQFTPGDIIHDFFPDSDVSAPPVVVIPAGSFLMGSLQSEADRSDSEGPKHRVTITRGFALGIREVSVGEFRLFTEATDYRTRAELEELSWVYDEGSSRMTPRESINWRHDFRGRRAQDSNPVLHVDWHDAEAYTQWLSRQTGQTYRLPTEAEWEYAIRAGSVSPYWWGSGSPSQPVENMTGDGDVSSSGRNWGLAFEKYSDGHWGPAPVGSFSANGLGLYDMAGNVSEWLADCWHETYVRAPIDGSAWINPGCQKRVVRGGYWAGKPGQARSAHRFSADSRLRGPRVGFRVARDL